MCNLLSSIQAFVSACDALLQLEHDSALRCFFCNESPIKRAKKCLKVASIKPKATKPRLRSEKPSLASKIGPLSEMD